MYIVRGIANEGLTTTTSVEENGYYKIAPLASEQEPIRKFGKRVAMYAETSTHHMVEREPGKDD